MLLNLSFLIFQFKADWIRSAANLLNLPNLLRKDIHSSNPIPLCLEKDYVHLLYRYWWNTRIFPFTKKLISSSCAVPSISRWLFAKKITWTSSWNDKWPHHSSADFSAKSPWHFYVLRRTILHKPYGLLWSFSPLFFLLFYVHYIWSCIFF